jgi:hypothetical protein
MPPAGMKPAEMTDGESVLMDTAMSSYRHVKQPADEAFEAMVKALRSPFELSPLRCADERKAAATCLQQAATLGASSEQEMTAAALKCREPVLGLEKCARALEAQAFEMMREGHRRMEEAKKQQQGGVAPVLNTE